MEFNEKLLKLIESPIENSKYILKGPSGSGKSTVLSERYKYLVENLHVPSEKVLIILLNKTQSLYWRNSTFLKASGNIWRTSYYGFIQSELLTFYPIVLKSCSEIVNRHTKPSFLSFEAAQFLISKVIDSRRVKMGILSKVTSKSDRIAADITSNLVKAAFSDISFDEIGERLFNSLEYKDESKKQVLADVDAILKDYRKRCLELGVFDFGLTVELYNNFLFKDEGYKEKLFERVKHLIVDDLEECVPSEVDFIEMLLPNLKTCLLGYNGEGGFGGFFGSNHKYVKQRIIDKCSVIEINKSLTCSDFMFEFSDMLFDNIALKTAEGNKENKENKVKPAFLNPEVFSKNIERNPPVELRGEMLEMLGERVIQLINEENYKPSEIVILSTFADCVTEYVLEAILKKQGLTLKNLSTKELTAQKPLVQALLAFAQLCHPSYGFKPCRDEVRVLLGTLFKLDPIRCSIIAEKICAVRPFPMLPEAGTPNFIEIHGDYNEEKYKYIKSWVDDYKLLDNPLPINDFFQKAFLEIFLSEKINEEMISQIKKLIDDANSFIEVVSKFNRNSGRDYLEMLKNGIKSRESIFELEEKLNIDSVLLSTPVSYLAGSLKHKVIILTSLSSKNWSPRNQKELTNNHVLSKTWDINDIYTEVMEEENQKQYLAYLLRSILKRCKEKLITFESTLSASGSENDGILTECFEDLAGGL